MPEPPLLQPTRAATSLLRFATAGSVDDGKSTLVGRLLYDTKSVLADQIEAVQRVSRDQGGDAGPVVAGRRPARRARAGHHHRRRLPLLLHAAAHVRPRRHPRARPVHAQHGHRRVDRGRWPSCSLTPATASSSRPAARSPCSRCCASRALVLAVNKIDLVDYDEETLTAIAKDFAALARSLGFPDDAVVAIPVSALVGDNVVERSERTPWYDGPTLLGHLESVPVIGPELRAPFRMPVQYVIRPRGSGRDDLHDYRGYAGQVASGTVAPGDEVVVLPGGRRTTVAAVDTADGPLDVAGDRRSVTILARGRHRHLPRRPARRRGRAAAGDERAGGDGLLARGEAAASRRPAAAQARHPDHPGDRRGDHGAAGPGDVAVRRGAGPAADQRHRARRLRTADALPVDDYADVRGDGQLPARRPADGQHAGRGAGRVPAGRRPGLSPPGTAPAPPRQAAMQPESGVPGDRTQRTESRFGAGDTAAEDRVSAASRARSQPVSSATRGTSSANRGNAAAALGRRHPRGAAGHVRPHVVPRHPLDQPGLDAQEPADPVRRVDRCVAQLAVADQQHLLAGERPVEVVQLLAVTTQGGVVPEVRPTRRDPLGLAVQRRGEVRLGLQARAAQVRPVGVPRSTGSRSTAMSRASGRSLWIRACASRS